MRALRGALLIAVLIAGALTGASSYDRAAAAPADNPNDSLIVWKVSLKLVGGPNAYWEDTFRQMATYPTRPDVIIVMEIPHSVSSGVSSATACGAIEKHLGSGATGCSATSGVYSSIHIDNSTSACQNLTSGSLNCGNTMIVFNKNRLEKVCTTGAGVALTGCAKRWKRYDRASGGCNDTAPYADQFAVQLKDKRKSAALGRSFNVIVSSLHLSVADGDDKCIPRNLQLMNDTIETTWGTRLMTVIGMDSNDNVDPRRETWAGDPTPWRTEEQQECWYRMFSQAHATTGCSAASFPGLSSMSDFPYYDAVWVRGGGGTNPSRPLCYHWTKGNKPGSNVATDYCQLEKGRIDFLFVRYENRSGTAIAPLDETPGPEPTTWASLQIPQAASDQGFYLEDVRRYSDHRAIYAELAWCAADALVGATTPCD